MVETSPLPGPGHLILFPEQRRDTWFLVLFSKKAWLALPGFAGLMCIAAIASFVIGYLHNENGSGGAAFDFATFHWPAVQLFTLRPWHDAVRNYPSAINPLAYLLASLVPWTEPGLRAASTLLAAATAILLALACRARLGTPWLHSALAGCLILVSPAFRSTAFWANTDPLALFFAVLSSLLLSACAGLGGQSVPRQCAAVAAVAVCAACAFYTRQFYAFVPVVCAWVLWRRVGVRPAIVAGVFAVVALPELWLIALWHGVNPPALHSQARPGWSNMLFLGTNLALFAVPLLAGAAASGWRPRPGWRKFGGTLACGAGLVIVALTWLGVDWPDAGGGGLAKAGLRLGWLATPFIVSWGIAGLSVILLTAWQSGTNIVLAAAFLPPFLIAYPVYERYFDPVVLVCALLFADMATARAISTGRALSIYFLFSVALLGISLLHFEV